MKCITEYDDSKYYHRARYILIIMNGVSTKSPGYDKVYLSLDNDLKNQIRMVLSCVASGSAVSILDNIWFK